MNRRSVGSRAPPLLSGMQIEPGSYALALRGRRLCVLEAEAGSAPTSAGAGAGAGAGYEVVALDTTRVEVTRAASDPRSLLVSPLGSPVALALTFAGESEATTWARSLRVASVGGSSTRALSRRQSGFASLVGARHSVRGGSAGMARAAPAVDAARLSALRSQLQRAVNHAGRLATAEGTPVAVAAAAEACLQGTVAALVGAGAHQLIASSVEVRTVSPAH